MDGSDSISPGIAPVTGLDITGAWHLADCLLTYANGKTQRPWASSASGYLIYSPNGHMCLSLNYPGRTGNIECISYCGQYEIVLRAVRDRCRPRLSLDCGQREYPRHRHRSGTDRHDRERPSGAQRVAGAGGRSGIDTAICLEPCAGSGVPNGFNTPCAALKLL
jgi:hypothetical protein